MFHNGAAGAVQDPLAIHSFDYMVDFTPPSRRSRTTVQMSPDVNLNTPQKNPSALRASMVAWRGLYAPKPLRFDKRTRLYTQRAVTSRHAFMLCRYE